MDECQVYNIEPKKHVKKLGCTIILINLKIRRTKQLPFTDS